jgi:prepilin-type N-terminal cleavage/methylation domain-containing protein
MTALRQQVFERVVRRARESGGFTLMELIVAMAILLIIMASLTTLMVSATRAQTNLDTRFQAQEANRLAMSKLEGDLHCASAVSPTSGATSTIVLTLPTTCTSGSGSITWCTKANGSTYVLWRIPSSTCTTTVSGAAKWASALSAANIFTPDATTHAGAPVFPDVAVTMTTISGSNSYRLMNTIYLRNGTRA